MKRTRLHKTAKGHMAQYEDWWYLVEEEDGTKYVEHEWDHVRVGDLSKNSGTERLQVDEFLAANHNGAAQEALRKLLQS